MNCVKCGKESGYDYPALCKPCFENAIRAYKEARRLFCRDDIIRDAIRVGKEIGEDTSDLEGLLEEDDEHEEN